MQKKIYLTVLMLTMLSVLTAVDLFSSGSQEDRLHEAEILIEQQEYNTAIEILTGILRDDPSKMNDVQILLNRVRTEKENYNDKYEELIVVYGGDEVEAAYPIIEELQTLDPNPNEATRISLVLARETAGFVFNNNRWVRIMEDAAQQLASEDYTDAVETYMTGFDLSRVIFQDAGYGNIIVNEIFGRADIMNAESQEFIRLYSDLLSKNADVSANYSSRSLEGYIRAVGAIYPDLKRVADIRESLKDTADYYILQEESIRNSTGTDKQVHYLIYMDRLLNGRTTVESPEGITGVIELFWNALYSGIALDAASYSGELFDEAVEQYLAGEYGEAGLSAAEVERISESSIATYNLGAEYLESDASFARPGLLTTDRQLFDSVIARMQTTSAVAAELPELMERSLSLDAFKNDIAELDTTNDDFKERGGVLKSALSSGIGEVADALAVWEQRLEELNAGPGGIETDKSIAAVTLPVDTYSTIGDSLLKAEIALSASLFNVDLAALQQVYSEIENIVGGSADLIAGLPAEGTEATEDAEEQVDFEVVYRYPDRALEDLLTVSARVNQLQAGISSVEQQIAAERALIRQSSEVSEISGILSELKTGASGMVAESESLTELARKQIFTAEKLKQEGERRIEDSRRLMRQANFASAKDRLEQAAAKFDESLSYLEDPQLREYRDGEIARLYDEIQVAENNLVVRQVREYLTQGKASYSQGNFPSAQAVLIKAQSRWADTNVEPNTEVEYWLTLTQTALSVTSGRLIAATDPLYTEMNQFLSKAREDFQAAIEEYNSGRISAANDLFDRAEQSILYVQQFFPFNEEARVLNLRISQYRAPEQFDEVFGNEFRTARRLISSNPQKAYIDLKDLEAIDSDYPGLQSAIVEAEYASGIKVRPPDPQKLARSNELYQLAYDIVSRNIRSEFNVAVSYLDEAINLNPDNDDAIRLKDRISTDVGGTATAVMSNADQQLYNEAVSEFTSGNYLKARIIVETLLKDAENQRNPKLLDLQERIERTR